MDIQQLNWKNFSKNILNVDLKSSLHHLEGLLNNRTYLVDDCLSDADKYVYTALHDNEEFMELIMTDKLPVSIKRYFNHLKSIGVNLMQIKTIKKPVKNETKKETKKESNKEEKSKSNVQFEEGGKFIGLNNAEVGKVVVRFPPEASGYLHIGHAKAALINQHYKDHYKGKLIMRFDDTNPAKESTEFEKIILEDVKTLGLTYDVLTYSSDHFDTLITYCEDLIRSNHAYADNTEPELMKKEREQCIDSKCRLQTPEENMNIWNQMKLGEGLKYCIRIKLDMQSKNGCMRDPTIYRCKPEHHIRTGNKYKVYPTYDFACPIVDSIEGVTHTLRTSEYNDRNEQFFRILDLVGLRKPAIADYSRLSLQNTVLSKRKLTYIVDQGFVDGWDDARMPTVRGVLRHGMTIEGLKEFVLAQGFGRANVVMEWDKIWAFNKKVIDPIAPRYTGLSGSDKSLVIVNVVDQLNIVKDSVVRHPKNEEIGKKAVWFTPTILVEKEDAVDFVEGTNVTFINWGNLLINKINKDNNGVIISIDAQLNLSDRDFKKTQKVTWMPLGEKNDKLFSIPMTVLFYDNIITKNVLDKDDDFKNYLNNESKREECLIGDIELMDLKKGDIIQLQRRGFFICDQEYKKQCPITGREFPLVLINIPEGNKKERPTVGQKGKTTEAKKEEGKEKKESSKEKKESSKDKKESSKDKKESSKDKKESSKDKETPKDKKENVESKKEGKEKKESIKKNKETTKTKKDDKEVKEQVDKKNGKEKSENNESQLKKVTKLGIDVTKEDNLADWYTQLIVKSELLEYYDISGCYILRPDSFSIWEHIQSVFDSQIKKLGVKNVCFPMFISKNCLEKEKDHIADFSPEVAWVTKSGDKDLEMPIAIRPTSETAMYPYYAKWIQSHRDLPLKLNQWCSVVRWEFKHPIPFLRTREFLWQEGHTAYANREDAVAEVYQILDLYASVYEDVLAIPVVKGQKTEKEKFAGADFTTTVEAYISASGRAIQGATSHHLGQNFSKMFEVTFESCNSTKEFAYQNSWGLTTRTIGILVMVHGDNKGLVLPPRLASTQVVIVPCGITAKTTEEEIQSLDDKCHNLLKRLSAVGVKAHADMDKQRSPGWKFNNWELKGIPIRIEIGPRDMANGKVVLCYRYNGEKETVDDMSMEQFVINKLEDIQSAMFKKAKTELDEHRTVAYTMNDFCQFLDKKMLICSPFCGDKSCEEKIKEISAREAIVEEGAPAMGAKSLCTPFEQPSNLGKKCVNDDCSRLPIAFTMFGRSY